MKKPKIESIDLFLQSDVLLAQVPSMMNGAVAAMQPLTHPYFVAGLVYERPGDNSRRGLDLYGDIPICDIKYFENAKRWDEVCLRAYRIPVAQEVVAEMLRQQWLRSTYHMGAELKHLVATPLISALFVPEKKSLATAA